MTKLVVRASAFAFAATLISATVAQTPPVVQLPTGQLTPLALTDASGKVIGSYTGSGNWGSVVIPTNQQPLFLWLGPDQDFATGRIFSTGLSWYPSPLRFASQDCSGQAFLANLPAPSGARRLAAAVKQGNVWTVHLSAQGPMFTQPSFQSVLREDGTCAQESTTVVWATPVEVALPLDPIAVPPFYVR